MSKIVGAAVVLSLFVTANAASAEQWTAKAKIVVGNCSDGAVATVNEEGNVMALLFAIPGGKQYADVKLNLSPDGSGKTVFLGAMDTHTSLEISAGKGKRQLKTAQTKGVCQWVWT
jgi:hypothetical protein